MDDLIIRFPTEAEEERLRRFRVNSNYLAAIDLYLDAAYGQDGSVATGLIAVQRGLAGYQRIQRRALEGRTAELRRFLTIAWASELQLRMAGRGDAHFLGYLNAWTPVHAYYAVYMSLQAWFAGMGIDGLADDHTGTLRTISRIVSERKLFPMPWSIRCVGSPELRESEIIGAPVDAIVGDHIEMLATPTLEDFWPRYAKMLETTRARRLDAMRREWLRQKTRKAMRAADKRQLGRTLFATTIFDFFWRMRIRANYRDVETFLLAPLDEASQRSFYSALEAVTNATCLLVQNLLVRQVGAGPYRTLVEEVLDTNPAFGEIGGFLVERADLIAPRAPRPAAAARG